jgi:small-conductance mechanosensitive channel
MDNTQLTSQLYIGKTFFTLGVLIINLLVTMTLKKVIDVIFKGVKNRNLSSHFLSKTRTIRGLLKNTIDVLFLLISLLIILSYWGVDIRPVLAGAGIVGIAISFGSQSLVKDILAGFFIIIEDQFNIGDKIKINDAEGVVEKITLRLTVLRDTDNNLIYIPNSQITTLKRYTNV